MMTFYLLLLTEDDEIYYHLYLNWGTLDGDVENAEIGPNLTRTCFFPGPKGLAMGKQVRDLFIAHV